MSRTIDVAAVANEPPRENAYTSAPVAITPAGRWLVTWLSAKRTRSPLCSAARMT